MTKVVACHNEGKIFEIPSQVHRSERALRCGDDVRHGKDTIFRGKREDIIYVFILVLNQRRLLSHNS